MHADCDKLTAKKLKVSPGYNCPGSRKEYLQIFLFMALQEHFDSLWSCYGLLSVSFIFNRAHHSVTISNAINYVLLAFFERILSEVLEPFAVQELAEGGSYHCPECRKSQGSGTPLKRKLPDKYVPSFLSILSFLRSAGNIVGVFIWT